MLSHPSPETLALLAEGTLEKSATHEVEAHLARCTECHEAYAEAVRFLLADEVAFGRLEGDLRTRALEVVTTGPSTNPILRLDKRHRWTGARRGLWPRLAGQFVVLAVGVTLVALGVGHLRRPPVDVSGLVRETVRAASMKGLVLPGGEHATGGTPTQYRGISGGFTDSLANALDQLEAMARTSGGNVESEVWVLAGYLAEDRLDMARSYADLARRHHPDEPRLSILQAVLAYRENELVTAEELLRSVLGRDPENALARLDLALVLRAGHRDDEARLELQRVVDEAPGTGLATRAERELRSVRPLGDAQ